MKFINILKSNLKLLISVAYICFLALFWQETFVLVQGFYHLCVDEPFPIIITLAVFLLWLSLFLFPSLVIKFLTLLLAHENQLDLAAKPIITIVLLSFSRAFLYILLLLGVLTGMKYFGGQTMTQFLPEFSVLFSKDYLLGQKLPYGDINIIYLLIVALPLSFSVIIPNCLLVGVNFISEMPIISLILIAVTLAMKLRDRNKAINDFKKRIIEIGDSENIKLNPKHYALLVEWLGGEDQLKQRLKDIEKLEKKFKSQR